MEGTHLILIGGLQTSGGHGAKSRGARGRGVRDAHS